MHLFERVDDVLSTLFRLFAPLRKLGRVGFHYMDVHFWLAPTRGCMVATVALAAQATGLGLRMCGWLRSQPRVAVTEPNSSRLLSP